MKNCDFFFWLVIIRFIFGYYVFLILIVLLFISDIVIMGCKIFMYF